MFQDHIKIIRKYDPYTATGRCSTIRNNNSYFAPSLRTLLHIWGGLCLLRVQVLQGHHVPVRLHLRLHRGLPHMCGGGGVARYHIYSVILCYITILLEWSNAAIAVSAGLLFGLITMLVQYVGLFMLGFHTGQQTKITNIGNSGRIQGVFFILILPEFTIECQARERDRQTDLLLHDEVKKNKE